MKELGRGLGDIGRAFRFLNEHASLWTWVIAPALVTLVLLVGVILGVAALADPLVAWLASYLPSFLERIGGWILTVIVVIGLGLAALLVFVSVAGMVAGPFNELLSEAVEEELTGTPGPPFSLAAFLRGALLGIAHGLRRLVVTLVGVILLFVLGFVPVVGTIAAAVLGVWLAGRGAAYDCYDAVLSRRELRYRDKLAYLERHRSRSLGLGIGVALMLFVPGLNLIALGLGAVGATLASRSLDAPGASHPPLRAR